MIQMPLKVCVAAVHIMACTACDVILISCMYCGYRYFLLEVSTPKVVCCHNDIQECCRGSNRGRTRSIDVSDSSVERERPCREKTLERICDELASIRDMVTDMMTLTSDLPIGLWRVLRDTFKCQICHGVPVKPPVIVTKCCKNMLGRQACVDTWYSGTEAMTKTCPICRAERGCNETMILRGLTEFIESILAIYLAMTKDFTDRQQAGSRAEEQIKIE